MDFVDVRVSTKGRKISIYPEFLDVESNDLMIRGNNFYAFWDERSGMWCRNDKKVRREIDKMVQDVYEEKYSAHSDVTPLYIGDYSTGLLTKWNKYCKEVGDDYHELDRKVVFENTPTKKKDYVSFKLPYKMEEGDLSAYNELISVLYSAKERKKLEWAVGSIIAGDSRDIQKFFVLYGDKGTGKSTIFHIMEWMFGDYCSHFRSKELGNPNNQFALETLKNNPLLAIDHDGDLSRIEDNTRLNTIVSHERMEVNEKYKSTYVTSFDTMLFIGTNTPVRITDSKSGLLRRLIDISPTGNLIKEDRYDTLMSQIKFELGAIAYHCLKVYLKYGKDYYNSYRPTQMLDETNDMYNFVADMLWDWEDEPYVSLASAWKSYKDWCEDCSIPYQLKKSKFKIELKEYFEKYVPEKTHDGIHLYYGLKTNKFSIHGEKEEEKALSWLEMSEDKHCVINDIFADCKAQYATEDELERPKYKWENVKTKLKELDTTKLHYVYFPKALKNHIVVDFDLKDATGRKSLLLNMKAASKFPKTYAEVSKSGQGIHLHYIYDGDVSMLSSVYDDNNNIEIKVFNGNASLRRKLSICNGMEVTTINSGLPLKKEKPMLDKKTIESEEYLIACIKKALNKEIMGHTKPECDYIKMMVDKAYNTPGLSYDIRELKPKIVTFAMSSTNQSQTAFEVISKLHYCSKDYENGEKLNVRGTAEWLNAPIVFFDVEVFPNLFIICYKRLGKENKVVKMINPDPVDVKRLFGYRLVGFNNRRYDNHILYAAANGYSNRDLFKLSQKIIGKVNGAFFGNAYNLSYTDIYDYCSNNNKMSLKKWQIKLGIYHLENQYAWDKDLDEQYWDEVAEYCANDVISTEAVWEATQSDWRARLILSELSGLTPNDTSNAHTQQIIFGNDKNPQKYFNYPDLSEEFPGYRFENGKSYYMGEEVGEGGWVYAKPGMYVDCDVEDVSGMHPASIYAMMLFGKEYTERYYDLGRVRTHIKHGEYDAVKQMFDGKLAKYLGSEKDAKALSDALKTPINSVYGLTAAHFPNRCRDPRNVDNVVAKRGALFMITLKHKVEEMGYTVVHCKTDSIKISNPDDKIIKFIRDFGKQYGYTFETEDRFERVCLVNGSTFIAKMEKPYIDDNGKEQVWYPKAAQFAHPYVFKTLFSKENIEFNDLCETKSVKSSLYLDDKTGLPDVTLEEKELKKLNTKVRKGENTEEDIFRIEELKDIIAKGHDYHFVGKVGMFTPVLEKGCELVSSEDEIKYDAVQGTKGYMWLESDMVKQLGIQDSVDLGYFDKLADDAVNEISKYGDFDIFVNAPYDVYKTYILDEVLPFDSAA